MILEIRAMSKQDQIERERGLALVAVLLIMSLMLMLAMAVTFTAVSDHAITNNFKNTTSGFYAAEAGINNLHRIIRSEEFILSSLPSPPRVRIGQPTLNAQDFVTVSERLLQIAEYLPNDSAYHTRAKITEVQIPYPADDNNPSHVGRRVTFINPTRPALGQLEPYSVKYRIESIGEGIAGLNGTVTLVEEGVINFTLLASIRSGGVRVGSFAEFALYLDKFDPYNPEGPFIYQGFGPGDAFSGRVHTNERFGFWTAANGADAPVFRGRVTQSYKDASYYRHGGGPPPPPVDADSAIVGGVLVAPKFLAGFERGVPPIPPATDSFNQARAVLDGGYTLSNAPPTSAELNKSLRAADQLDKPLAAPKNPDSTEPELPPGIYLPSDGQGLTGSGIYVMGDADQITLSADPATNRQIIRIKQGLRTVTITIDIDAGTTTIDYGRGSRTLSGIPMDRSMVAGGNRPGASLYVRGNIKSLSGPGRDADGQPLPAIDSSFSITITAGAFRTNNDRRPVEGGNITITGDLTYETPVVDAAGNPINQKATNMLGIYASGGNIEIPIDGRAPDNLTVHASMAAFQLRDSQGNLVTGPDGRSYGGRIRSDLRGWERAPNRGRFTLVGGMQASIYDNFGVYDGIMHGYTYQGVWDARYDRNIGPPFYPGYVVDLGDPEGEASVKTVMNAHQILSYRRIYYGSVSSEHQ
jgi:hypothetical protein